MSDIPYKGIRTDGGDPGSYDIAGNYDWTSLPKGAALRQEAPSAYITAYELEYSQLRSFIDGYMNILSPQNSAGEYNGEKAGLDFYKGLYSVNEKPIARFNFPFFGDNFRSFSSEFADTFSPVSQRGAQMFGAPQIQGLFAGAESIVGGGLAAVNSLASFGDSTGSNLGDGSLADKIAKTASSAASTFANKLGLNPGMQTIGAPGTYIETPKFYQYSNTDNGLQIAFTLSNTLDEDSIEKNFKFICDFTKINRPYRYGPIGMTFPAIYNVVVPGLRYIQWASLEGFDVSLLGNRRKIGNHIIPEAYVCQFNFKSLTVEPANFVNEICEGVGGTDGEGRFSSFSSYTTNQVKEELEIQKGKQLRDRSLQNRKALFDSVNEGSEYINQSRVSDRIQQFGSDDLTLSEITRGLSEPFAAEPTSSYLQDLARDNFDQYSKIIKGLHREEGYSQNYLEDLGLPDVGSIIFGIPSKSKSNRSLPTPPASGGGGGGGGGGGW